MKKLLSSILCLALIITGAIALSACGKKENPNEKVAGTYVCTSITYNDTTYNSASEVPDYMQQMKDVFSQSIVVNADGTYTAKFGDEVLATGTYTLDGNKITVTIDGEDETSEFTLEDNKITMSDSGATIVFTKQ